jgi:hypothetical protein
MEGMVKKGKVRCNRRPPRRLPQSVLGTDMQAMEEEGELDWPSRRSQ